MRKITNGELQTYKDCKRKWWLGWFRRFRPARPDRTTAAALGSLVHSGLSTLYEGGDPLVQLQNEHDATLALIEAEAAAAGQAVDGDLLKKLDDHHKLAWVMIEGYIQWLAETGADQGLKIVGNEQKVEVALPGHEGVYLMGKLDIEAERTYDDSLLFLDHKTVQSISDSASRLHMDEQMLHYHLIKYLKELELAEAEQRPMRMVDGALYNMLRKVKRTARATPPFYDRVEIRHSHDELQAYYRRVWGEVRDILETEKRLETEDPRVVAYPRPSRDCSWKCEFFPVCPLIDTAPAAAEAMLAGAYEHQDPLDRYQDQDGVI